MNLLHRIERLEKLRADMPTDLFIITHEEFLTLTLAEITLRHPAVDGVDGKGVPSANIEGADRIGRIRRHPQKTIDNSAYFAVSAKEWPERKAAAMKQRILVLQAAYDTGDHTGYRKQRAKDRKALLARAEAVVERLEAEIARMPQTAG